MEERLHTFEGKKVLVVGLARSGTGAANLLSSLGAEVSVTDNKPRSALDPWLKRLSSSVNVITDSNPLEIFGDADLIVISPGVPLNIPPLLYAREKGIPVIGELELAYQALMINESEDLRKEPEEEISPPTVAGRTLPVFIGVTGTNGKSTTTTLIDLMLKESGRKSLMGGNIGNALTEEILKAGAGDRGPGVTSSLWPEYIVAEISSFQLESIDRFRPRISVILNITPDHLDRYDNIRDYINAKARIFENQTSGDYLILNADDPVIIEMYNTKISPGAGNVSGGRQTRGPEVLFFSRQREVKGIFQKDGVVYCNVPDIPGGPLRGPLIRTDEIRLKGVHNQENAMAASLAAMMSGCPYDAARAVLKNFPGLEHRLEFVDEIDGTVYINDSKGTNVGAVAKSLESFNHIILIMGGLDKGGDFTSLRETIREKVRHLILLGESKDKIAREIGGATEISRVSGLKEAVALSASKASPGDIVLLSPGCASFDMFVDFEDRGRQFKKLVSEIKNK